MGIADLFSKRRKRETGSLPDVYLYDEIPEPFRVQMVHMWVEYIGHHHNDTPRGLYHLAAKTLRKEYGRFSLVSDNFKPDDAYQSFGELQDFFLSEINIDRLLDVIELTLRIIDRIVRDQGWRGTKPCGQLADEAIEEFNQRAREHGVGYTYADGMLVRVDSELIHQDVVKPVLALLRGKRYANAQTEFLSAHEHYRSKKYSECLVDCLKAFESVMKIVAAKRGWKFDPNKATAKDLVALCLEKGLIPAYWQTHFAGLRSVLESGIPTPRNRQGGHGAGVAPPQTPPPELAAYVLHMTASTILFLSEAERSLP